MQTINVKCHNQVNITLAVARTY